MEVVVKNDEQQMGTKDCGLFAIANCICLANRKSISKVRSITDEATFNKLY